MPRPNLPAKLLLAAMLACNAPLYAHSLLISDVILVSPERAAPLVHAHVLVRDGRIAEIRQSRPRGRFDQTLDARGRWLTPGLIDSHVHLGSDAGLREDQAQAHPELRAAFLAQEPRSYLYFGFTHLVDLNESEDFIRQWRALPLAPGLSYCKSLPFPGGYGEAFLPESVRNRTPYLLDDPAQRESMPEGYEPEEHTPDAVLAKVARTPAICVKTYFETGFAGLWDWPVPSDALIADVHQAAKARGRRHVHHANSLAGYRQGLAARVDVLAHGLWHWDAHNAERKLPPAIAKLLDELIAAGIAIQPTSQVLGAELRLFDPAFLDDPRLRKAVPAALLDFYRSEDAQWFRRKMEQNLQRTELVQQFLGAEANGDPRQTSQVALDRLQLVVRYLHAQGGRLLLGSDTPSSPTYTNPPGLNGLLELQFLQDAGLSPHEALLAATLDNARSIGLDGELGSIEVGKRADLLLLSADPLASVQAFDHIDQVILGGRVIKRETLAADACAAPGHQSGRKRAC
ncbi:MAG: amidohydrolase family protein [Xanthomonadales bacterium]|nr:amidohydrolase family protein [Xanthomonadales bacterium]MCB1611949.1 amidohydrolase family protein [Xanthomonadales bacterium]MCP5475703.1 amidohydrolase family protein [Rhodanobacteraceae bacterium]